MCASVTWAIACALATCVTCVCLCDLADLYARKTMRSRTKRRRPSRRRRPRSRRRLSCECQRNSFLSHWISSFFVCTANPWGVQNVDNSNHDHSIVESHGSSVSSGDSTSTSTNITTAATTATRLPRQWVHLSITHQHFASVHLSFL